MRLSSSRPFRASRHTADHAVAAPHAAARARRHSFSTGAALTLALSAGLLSAGLLPGSALSQDKTVPVLQRGAPLQAIAAPNKALETLLVGTWGNSRKDAETGETETTLITFKADGTYATRLRSSLFPDREKQPLASGRYIAKGNGKDGFTLLLDRAEGDPEADKATTRSTLEVTVVDDNTLRAPDGALLTRTK